MTFGGRFRVGHRAPSRPWYKLFWWDACSFLCLVWLKVFHRMISVGFERIPEEGPVIFVSNHQSYYDPLINGCAVNRRQYSAIASSHLARFKPLGWLLSSYGTVFVAASAGDKGALKAALSELKQGSCVLIYPEGSRCSEGFVEDFEKGILLLLKRSDATVYPIGIDGAFDVWPRSRVLPRLWGRGRIATVCGEPIDGASLFKEGPQVALERLHLEIDTLRLEARRILRERSGGRWPAAGPLDDPSPKLQTRS